MSRQPSGGSWRESIARLGSPDLEWLATAVVAGGTVLALWTVLLGGFLPSGSVLARLLYLPAVLFPAIGVAIAAVACWWAWTVDRATDRAMIHGPPPETAATRTEQTVGRETERTLTAAAQDWYHCRQMGSTREIRRRLADGAVRVVRTRRGLTVDAAREAVRSGTWTDDPVAAAFLADELRQPLVERLRASVDPGAAHARRVRRTLAAIDAIDDGADPADAEVDR